MIHIQYSAGFLNENWLTLLIYDRSKNSMFPVHHINTLSCMRINCLRLHCRRIRNSFQIYVGFKIKLVIFQLNSHTNTYITFDKHFCDYFKYIHFLACNIFLNEAFYKQRESERIDTLSICSPLYPKLAWFRRLGQGWHNLFKPSVLFMKYKQAVQTKISMRSNSASLVGLWWCDFPGGEGILPPCPPSGIVHERPHLSRSAKHFYCITKPKQ